MYFYARHQLEIELDGIDKLIFIFNEPFMNNWFFLFKFLCFVGRFIFSSATAVA